MYQHEVVEIHKSEHTTMRVVAPAWEVPLLALVHGGDVTRKTGDTVAVRRAKPDAADEFARLEARYRRNEDSGVAPVEAIYGHGERGIAELAKVIAAVDEQEGPTGDLGEMFEETGVGSEDDDPMAGLFETAPNVATGARPIDE